MAKMKATPVNDFFAKNGNPEDGRMVHDMYLMQVKKRKNPAMDYLVIEGDPWGSGIQPFPNRVRWSSSRKGGRQVQWLGITPQGATASSWWAHQRILCHPEPGAAVIFGVEHRQFHPRAQYMMGAFVAWMGLTYFGINYWWSLILTAGRGRGRHHSGVDAAPALSDGSSLRSVAHFRRPIIEEGSARLPISGERYEIPKR